MKKYLASSAAFLLLAVSLSGCIWYPRHGGYHGGGGYGHANYGGGGGGGYHRP